MTARVRASSSFRRRVFERLVEAVQKREKERVKSRERVRERERERERERDLLFILQSSFLLLRFFFFRFFFFFSLFFSKVGKTFCEKLLFFVSLG